MKKARKSDDAFDDPFKDEDTEEGDKNTMTYSYGSGGYQEAIAAGTLGETSFQFGA